MTDERETRIVELAVQAAGAADAKWQERVVSLVPRVAALFREPHDEADPNSLLNTARKVAEANVFTSEYRGHEYDENTKRVFVKLWDEKNQDGDYLDDDGCQTVRTEPMWSATGRATRRVLESMMPGQRAVFYRYTEQIDRKRKMGLLVHLEPLGTGTRDNAAPQPPPTGSSAPSRQAGDGDRPSPSPAASLNPNLDARFDKFTNRQKVAFMHLCRNNGITAPLEVGIDDIDKVLVYMDQIEKEKR